MKVLQLGEDEAAIKALGKAGTMELVPRNDIPVPPPPGTPPGQISIATYMQQTATNDDEEDGADGAENTETVD